jgi:aspartate carbamoyltransferase regulatory subunit
MPKTRPIPDIEQGTVIDHIEAGYGLQIAKSLHLLNPSIQIVLCLNLDSKKLGRKDLMKISPLRLPEKDLDKIAVFSPQATVNWIENYVVTRKSSVPFPDEMEAFFTCPNQNCISRERASGSKFLVHDYKKSPLYECRYCARTYAIHELKEQVVTCL